ncbi:MAG: M67 family metallopeptidase [Anaerolineae bacterium]
MILTPEQIADLIAQARRDAPNETCGLIGGREGRAERLYPLANEAEHPQVEYRGAALQQLEAMRDMETQEQELLAIYHSHPASPAFPSPTDVERAFYPDAVYIVISLMHPRAAQVRGFTIQNAQVTEVTLEITEEVQYGQARTHPRRHQKGKGGPAAHRPVAPLSQGRPGQRPVRRAGRRVSK